MEKNDVMIQSTDTISSTSSAAIDELLNDENRLAKLTAPVSTIRFCFVDDDISNDSGDDAGIDIENNSDDDVDDVNGNTTPYFTTQNNIDPHTSSLKSDVVSSSVDNLMPNTIRRPERQQSIIDEDQIDNNRRIDICASNSTMISPTSEYFSGGETNTELSDNSKTEQKAASGIKKKSSVSSDTSHKSDGSSSSRPSSQERFNPFDKDIEIEDDHFPVDSVVRRSKQAPRLNINRPHSASSSNTSDDLLVSVDEDEFVFAHLGLDEDYFAQPEGAFGLSTTEELEMAIEHCKDLIIQAEANEERKQGLVKKLVQLRLKLQEAKEGPQEVAPDTKVVLGHHFIRKDSRSAKHHCEKCVGVIWGMLQIWYKCIDCGYSCHSKCLGSMTRMCALQKVQESPQYTFTICPEKGLAAQQYRCSECRTLISFHPSFDEPRQCDYNGCFYCAHCHWNDTTVIPARVLHNWDFTPAKVCRASKQYLKIMVKKPVICVQKVNPMLFSFVEELNEIRRIRQEILMMKQYFLSCQEALTSKLLLQLRDRQGFVDNSDMYSLQDLVDLENDRLLPELCKIHTNFAQHIKTDCHLCQAKGHICELCNTEEALFPFDNHVFVCDQCQAVLHRHCYRTKNEECPRCYRKKAKMEASAVTATLPPILKYK